MASIITIILFFVYTSGLGFTGTYLLKKPEQILERFFLNVGVGLGLFVFLSILLNFLHIPLDWKIFLILSTIFPVYTFFKKGFPKLEFKFTKSNLVILAVMTIFLFSFYMYSSGAFSYPYLEDEDTWGHAVGAKYVALEKTAYDPPVTRAGEDFDVVLSYIDPYPPGYDILMGVLHQTSPNLKWTLKFFNALIISLGLVFFYLFAKKFIGSSNKSLLATFFLASVPSYLSHFIWAHALVITLIFPVLYAFENIKDDKRWSYLAAFLFASVWFSQNFSQPVKISTMLAIYLVVICVAYNKLLKYHLAAFFSGIALSFLWTGVMIKKYTLSGFVGYFGGYGEEIVGTSVSSSVPSGNFLTSIFSKSISFLKGITSSGGSGSRPYTFGDFFNAYSQNQINNPIGIGVILSLLVGIALIYLVWHYRSKLMNKENYWRAVSLFWLIFTFWGVNGQTFPISVARGPFRVWMLLAIPVSLLAVEGSYFIKKFISSFYKSKLLKIAIITLILIGVFYTSGIHKYELNTTNTWPTAGAFQGNSEEAKLYAEWFDSIPLNTKVFMYSPRDKITIGLNGESCLWCQDIVDFREEIIYKDAEELYSFLKSHQYEYFIINGRMEARYFTSIFGEEKMKELLPQRYNEIASSGLFQPAHQVENSFVVLRIV